MAPKKVNKSAKTGKFVKTTTPSSTLTAKVLSTNGDRVDDDHRVPHIAGRLPFDAAGAAQFDTPVARLSSKAALTVRSELNTAMSISRLTITAREMPKYSTGRSNCTFKTSGRTPRRWKPSSC